MHGHQAYVRAVDDAHRAIDAWKAAAETLMRQASLRRPFFCSSPRDEAAYRQIQEAGHPALEDAQADLDQAPAETAERLRAELDQAHERRTELAAQTLPFAQPAAR